MEENINEANLEEANYFLGKLLVGACVESYGISHQMLFIEFRDSYSTDHLFIIDADVLVDPPFQVDGISNDERNLLSISKVNLKFIDTVTCDYATDLEIVFTDGSKLKILGSQSDTEEPWQLTNRKPFGSDEYVSVIALNGGGYAIWGKR